MTFKRVSQGETISSVDIQNNFEHIGTGHRSPMSGDTAMSDVNGAFNVGSLNYKWDKVFPGFLSIDKQLNSNTSRTVVRRYGSLAWSTNITFTALEQKAQYSGLRKTWNKIGEIVTTDGTKNTIGFTGLNGDVDIIYKLTMMVVTDTLTSHAIRFNDIAPTGTSSNMAIVASTSTIAMTNGSHHIFKGGDVINFLETPASTISTGWLDALIYAKTGTPRMVLSNAVEGMQGTATNTNAPISIRQHGGVWHNTKDTVTAIYITNRTGVLSKFFLTDSKFQLWARLG